MTVFQFGVRVTASPREGAGRAEVGVRARSTEPDGGPLGGPLVAPLVLGICLDAVVESGAASRQGLVYFDRAGASLPAAVVTSVLDLERSGLDCLAVVPDDDLVTLGVIAPRLGLPPGAAGGLLDGPAPVVAPVAVCGGLRLFRWSDIVARLRSRSAVEAAAASAAPAAGSAAVPAVGSAGTGPGASAGGPAFAALNLALRLRRLIRADPALAGAVRDLLAS